MPDRYPEIEPYDHGMLDVGDGNHVYWEVCGNPDGKPAVVLHGGPGSGCAPGSRRYFDPAAYRVVQFDQRGCGRSTPHASDPATDMSVNTTDHLVADLELLREHLGIDRWLVWGASWGSVLGLVYALRHTERVSEIVLSGVATGQRAETDLLTRGLAGVYPKEWARFRDAVPEEDRDGDLSEAYRRLMESPDPAVRAKASRDWCDWEDAMLPASPPHRGFDDPAYRAAFVRIVTHYWSHGSWLDEGVVIREAGRLAGVPGFMVQGALDLGNLIGTPWLLADAWPGSELTLVDAAPHSGSDDTRSLLIAAADRFART